MEYADRDLAVSVEHSWSPRSQLVERYRQRDADRAQGRGGRRQGPGDDDPRSADEAGTGQGRVGVLQQRAEEGTYLRALHLERHAGADALEQGDPREVSREDAAVLLRPHEVPDLSRSAGHQVPDRQDADLV